jgi:transposase
MAMAPHITTIHLVCDKVSTHHGKDVRKWGATHARLVLHVTPVHCSWINQVEQCCSILQRTRWRSADCASKEHLQAKLSRCIRGWNQQAHPFNPTCRTASVLLVNIQRYRRS